MALMMVVSALFFFFLVVLRLGNFIDPCFLVSVDVACSFGCYRKDNNLASVKRSTGTEGSEAFLPPAAFATWQWARWRAHSPRLFLGRL